MTDKAKAEAKSEPKVDPEPDGGWIVYKDESGNEVRIPVKEYQEKGL